MQVNANTQVSVDVLKKAIDANKNQVNDLLNMQQNAQNKLQTQTQKNDTVPKSNTIGSLFDKKV
jgi:flagellar biosynthesis chaperone FliJ